MCYYYFTLIHDIFKTRNDTISAGKDSNRMAKLQINPRFSLINNYDTIVNI